MIGRILLFVLALFSTGCARAEASRTEVSLALEYHWGPEREGPYRPLLAGVAFDPPGRDGASELWVRASLPDLGVTDPAVAISAPLGLEEVLVGDRRIYRRGDIWTIVPLPDDHAGKQIELHYRSPRVMRIGGIVAGDHQHLFARAFRA